MNDTLNAGEHSEDIERVRALKLSSLLHDLVRREGRMKAASLLGVNYKTVVRAEESGRISPRVGDALEGLLEQSDDPGQSRLRERMGALEENVDTLAKEMRRGFADIKAAVEVHARVNAQSQVQDREEVSRSKIVTAPTVKGLPPSKPYVERRTDPTVVTMDPAEDDEQVYGAAWPLVEEWRRLRTGHSRDDGSLSWMESEHRLLTLELAMMEQHELTLPPEMQPLRGFGRRNQTVWRWEALQDARKALPRRKRLRWVRRVLTLGLWRR